MELKLEDFKPADKGQMELYLGWLNRYERKDGELRNTCVPAARGAAPHQGALG